MSAPYGELVVVLGDAHVGHRAGDIPDKFKKMLTPDKMQHLVSTGNLCTSETYDFFRSVAPSMHSVRGDMDDYSSSNTSAEEAVFEVGEFRLGVCHGHQIVPWGDREALGLLARRLDVDILITGHTHVCEAFEVEGTWFVNPGSITGAYTPLRDDVRASFVLLSIQANTVKLYMYELNSLSGEVDIRRARFTKPSKNPFLSSSLVGGPPAVATKSTATTIPKTTSAPVIPKRPQPSSPAVQQPIDQSVPVQKRAPPPRPAPTSPPPAVEVAQHAVSDTEATVAASMPVEPAMLPPVQQQESAAVTDIGKQIDEELNFGLVPSSTTAISAADIFSAAPPPPVQEEVQVGEESKQATGEANTKEDEQVMTNDDLQTKDADDHFDDV